MIRRPPRSTLFPYTNALPISVGVEHDPGVHARFARHPPLPADADVRREVGGREEVFGKDAVGRRSEEHTSELQSQSNLVCRLLLEKKKKKKKKKNNRKK